MKYFIVPYMRVMDLKSGKNNIENPHIRFKSMMTNCLLI